MGELQAVYYYYCEETQKDAFYATVSSVNVSKYCESDFSATLTATVECGSGSYSYSWDITNGSAYSGHSTSTLSVVHANANGAPKCYTDVTKNKKCTITVTDKVWKTSGGTSSTTSGSYTLGSLRFTPNTFVGPSCEFDVPYGWYGSTVTGNSASIGSNRGNGYGTLTYTWYKSTSPDGSYSAISNSNAQSLSITRPANTTFYKQYATNSSCPSETYHDGYTTTNGKDYFICVVPIAATASPSSASTYYGGSVSLSCSSTGGRVSKTYKWYSSTSSGGTYSVIQGATSASYTPTSLTATQYYKCLVADDDHPSGVYSNVVTVSVRSQLVAGSISGGGTTYSGGSVRLTASAATGGNGSYGYQWQVYNGSQWSDMSGKTSLTCDVSESNTGTTNLSKKYRLKVTGDSQTKYTGEVTVTWRPQLVAGTISGGGVTTYSGNSVSLSVGAASGGNSSSYSYQWQESSNGGGSWTNVGTNSRSYSASGSGVTKNYRVIVTDADNQKATASAVSVTWRSPLAIGTITGGGVTTYSGNSVSLSVGAASGGNSSSYSYQWQESSNGGGSWTNVGTNSRSYSASGSGATKNYRVIVTDGDGQKATASAVSVTWRSPLAIGTITGGNVIVGSNTSVTL